MPATATGRHPFWVTKAALIAAALSAFLVPAAGQYYFQSFDGPRQIVRVSYESATESTYTVAVFDYPVLSRAPGTEQAANTEHTLWSVAPVTVVFTVAGFAGWVTGRHLARRWWAFRSGR